MRIALVAPSIPETPADLASHRLAATGAALTAAGAHPELVLYDDDHAGEVRDHLMGIDGALVWVNPEEQGHDRSRLNEVLREVASSGVMVSAHPDAIDAIGTKEVVFHTRHLGWGTDTRLYESWEAMSELFPDAVRTGPRVVKRERGNGGNGVWKVELLHAAAVLVRHAARGSTPQSMALDQFVGDCAPYFENGASMIDQAYQPLLSEGMIRCYLVGDRVAGFGEQAVNALHPPPPGAPAEEAPQPGPRLYYPPDRDDLQHLRERMESEWVPLLCQARGMESSDLPVIWDADFLHGPPDEEGTPGYVLCEINVSSVYPFPDSALGPLAAETIARVAGHR
ncbi:MAG: Cj0069 family protein [Acidimicrobiia bacterium]